jgi:hypothetical protein
MMMKLVQVTLLFAGGLSIAGCQLDGAKTSAPAKKPPAADYQAAAPASPANINKAICYNDADLATVRGRMLQQEFAVATLQCQTAGGGRAFESLYSSFLSKFTANGELSANARAIQQLSRTKRFNLDVLVTEFANRTAQKAPVDPGFCARNLRAFEWALDPKVTTLAQVPPPYDLGPDMNINACTPK